MEIKCVFEKKTLGGNTIVCKRKCKLLIYFMMAFFFSNLYLAVLSLSYSLSCSVWDLVPWPGIESSYPALQATGPPRKSLLKKKKKGVNLTQVLSWVHASEHLHMCVPVFFSNGRHLPFQTQPKCHLIPSLSSHNSFKTVQYLSEILELGPLLPTEASGRGLFN